MLTFALAAGLAWATSEFPAVIADVSGMPCTPTCNICHGSAGGGGPMATEFGMALADCGMHAGDAASLRDALGTLESDGTDSDGDGVADLDELAAGSDPSGGPEFCAGPAPTYGCVSHLRSAPAGALAILAMAAAILRRQRKETR